MEEAISPGELPTHRLTEQVVSRRRLLDAAESMWLALLVEFDKRCAWAADGALCAVDWLVVHCGLGRSTAKEKLRVAYELDRRPLISEAFAKGEVSYSKVRAMTRIFDAGEDLDRAMLEVARAGTAADLDRVVAEWAALREQEQSPDKWMRKWERRGLRHHRRYDGLGMIEIVADIEHTERLVAAVDAYLRKTKAAAKAAAKPVDKAVEEAPAGASLDDPLTLRSWSQQRADALVDLLEETVARLTTHDDPDRRLDPEACLINVLTDYERLVEKAAVGLAELGGGAPLTGEAARRLACDAGLVRIITKGASEVLDVGRKTQHWNRAQRRAILARHHHRCAVRGCVRRVVQIHHTHPFGLGGETNVDLGIPLCYGHHHLVHEGGWTAAYEPATGVVTLTSPRGHQIVSPPLKRAA